MNESAWSDRLDGGVIDLTPPSQNGSLDPATREFTAVPHRHRLLVAVANQTLPHLAVPLMQGKGLRDYLIETPQDPAIAIHWLTTRSYDVYLLDEYSLQLLKKLPDAARLEIERRSVVVTVLGASHPAAMTCAACIPIGRVTVQILEHHLWQVVRLNDRRGATSKPRSEGRIYETLLRLLRGSSREAVDIGTALQPLTECASTALGTARASVWIFREDPKRLVCIDMYDARTRSHVAGMEVPAGVCIRYCLALRDHRILAIEDTLTDDRCRELVPIYLRDAGIGALLDAPIFIDGEVVGLFCNAHVGGTRAWNGEEIHLASSFADHAQLAILTERNRQTELDLAKSRSDLAQAQKMEALARLAGGVAHDFNNLLTVIAGNSELIRKYSPSIEAQRKVDTVLLACDRSRDLVKQLLCFSNPTATPQPAWVNVHMVINEVCAMVETSLDKRIQVRRELAASCVTVHGDSLAIQRSILNLMLNARDAMESDGGDLVIRTQLLYRMPPGPSAAKEMLLEVAVSDTGSGMSPDVQKRIMEPFFTTKPVGKGLGLGLVNVYGCAKAHGGSLTFESSEGVGTTFRLTLPIPAKIADHLPASPLASSEAGGPVSILVVDDDDSVRDTIEDMLTFLGHRVRAVSDGKAASAALANPAFHVDLALIDMQMPGMSGRDCFRALRLIRPHLRCIMMSGSGKREDMQECMAAGAAGTIDKPFSQADLVHVVQLGGYGSADAPKGIRDREAVPPISACPY